MFLLAYLSVVGSHRSPSSFLNLTTFHKDPYPIQTRFSPSMEICTIYELYIKLKCVCSISNFSAEFDATTFCVIVICGTCPVHRLATKVQIRTAVMDSYSCTLECLQHNLWPLYALPPRLTTEKHCTRFFMKPAQLAAQLCNFGFSTVHIPKASQLLYVWYILWSALVLTALGSLTILWSSIGMMSWDDVTLFLDMCGRSTYAWSIHTILNCPWAHIHVYQ